MRTTEQPSRCLLFLGMLGIAVGACGGSDVEKGGTGGSTPSGGAEPSASGGLPGDGSGGTPVASGGAMSGGSNTGGTADGGAVGGNTGGRGAETGGSGGSTSTEGSGGASEGNTGGRGAETGGRGGSTSVGGSGGASEGNTGGRGAGTGGRGGSTSVGGSGGASEGNTGGSGAETGGSTSVGGSGGAFTGTCTESKPTGRNASGSGPHDVVIETNTDPGINEGTIFRPADLGGDEKYPIFVWGEGACTQDGLSNATAMAEIASHGYFVVADGTPNGTEGRPMDRSDMEAMGAPLIAYIDWAVAENEKPCSAYYQSLDTTKISSNGFSCGGLMSQGTVTDPRITTWGVTSSGMAGANQAFYDPIHTPVLFVEGGSSDMAYDGGLEGYDAISKLGVPVMWFSKDLGHGGDLFTANGGDFTKINLAWLNWWLKGDETATGKGLLVGAGCPYCSDSAWDVRSQNVP